VERRFVDCHSHVVPSGDDGARTLEDGLQLCDLAADAGTAILFATPHVWPHLLLSEERELQVRRAHEGTDVVLVEMPFLGPVSDLVELAEHVERAGFTPLVAHPERTEPAREEPERAFEVAERWPLQLNATSLVGYHGREIQELAWRLLDVASVVASDGHRLARPARLDEAFELVRARVGEEDALPLFDGSALGVSLRALRPTPSRASAPSA
jgi:protein-tyrosine phosphatase